jgi:hypothetical protein
MGGSVALTLAGKLAQPALLTKGYHHLARKKTQVRRLAMRSAHEKESTRRGRWHGGMVGSVHGFLSLLDMGLRILTSLLTSLLPWMQL